MRKEKKNWIIGGLIAVIVIMTIFGVSKEYDCGQVNAYKEHFAMSLSKCLKEKESQETESRRCYDSLLGWKSEDCVYRESVNLEEEYISNWVRRGYTCNIYEIKNNSINCYMCSTE